MGKVLSIIIGTLVAVAGIVLVISWWYELLFVLRGTVPAILIFGGIIALIAGITELKDTLKSKEKK